MYSQILSYSAALYAASYVTAFLSIGLTAILARHLGAEALGEYAFYSIIYSLGQVICSFGLPRTLIKYMAEGKEDRTNLYTLYFLFSLGLTAVTTMVAVVTAPFASATIVLAIATTGPCVCIGLTTSILRANFEKSKEIGILWATSLLVFCSTLILLVSFPHLDHLIPILGTTIAYAIITVTVLWYFYKFLISPYRDSLNIQHLYKLAKRLSSFSFPLWTSSIGSHANEHIDQYAVKYLMGSGALGEYYLAIRIFEFLEKPITILSKVLMATFSTPEGKSIDVYKNILNLSHAVFPFLALSAVAATPWLVPLLYTDRFLGVAIIFSVMSIAFAFKGIETVNGIITITQNHPYINQRSQLTALPINTLGLYALVQAFQAMGAATAKGFTRGVYAFLHTYLMKKVLPEQARFSQLTCVKSLLLYLGVLGGMLWARHPAVWVVGPFLYLVAGHCLRIWNLGKVVVLVRSAMVLRRKDRPKVGFIESDNEQEPCLRDVERLLALPLNARVMFVVTEGCALRGRMYVMSTNDKDWRALIPTGETVTIDVSGGSTQRVDTCFIGTSCQAVDCVIVHYSATNYGKGKECLSLMKYGLIIHALKRTLRPGGYLYIRLDGSRRKIRLHFLYYTLQSQLKYAGFYDVAGYICMPTFHDPKYFISFQNEAMLAYYFHTKKKFPGLFWFALAAGRMLGSFFFFGWLIPNKVLIAKG